MCYYCCEIYDEAELGEKRCSLALVSLPGRGPTDAILILRQIQEVPGSTLPVWTFREFDSVLTDDIW